MRNLDSQQGYLRRSIIIILFLRGINLIRIDIIPVQRPPNLGVNQIQIPIYLQQRIPDLFRSGSITFFYLGLVKPLINTLLTLLGQSLINPVTFHKIFLFYLPDRLFILIFQILVILPPESPIHLLRGINILYPHTSFLRQLSQHVKSRIKNIFQTG